MTSILIDTNVLVYFYDPNTPDKQKQAELVLNRLQQTGMGCLSVQNLAEFIRVGIRKLDPPLTAKEAFEQAAMLAEAWPVFNLTPMIILEAVRGVRDHALAYYDAQIWASARLNQIPIVFSEDFQDGLTLEGVRFINPFGDDFSIEDW
jgi:predicted nucleic acid-binding protein